MIKKYTTPELINLNLSSANGVCETGSTPNSADCRPGANVAGSCRAGSAAGDDCTANGNNAESCVSNGTSATIII